MEKVFPENVIVKTEKAVFHVTITPFRDRDSDRVVHYTVNIGSRDKKCVQINVPSIESGNKEGVLIWVEKIKPVCYLDEEKDSKNLSQFTINLGFTIARDINPECYMYKLQDCSSFPCKLPNGKTTTVSMKAFFIAFHGNTWYEQFFGAELQLDHANYKELKLNMYDSAKKPASFSFKNAELDELLSELYTSTKTWHAFFQAIQHKYKESKCAVVYPWIVDAMLHIFEGNYMFENPGWVINLDKNKKAERTPLIPFTSYEDTELLGRRTRGGGKTRRGRIDIPTPPVYTRNIPEIQAMKYGDFLRKIDAKHNLSRG